MIKLMTRLEKLQWEHQKLQRSRNDLKMVRDSFMDRNLTQETIYNDISQVINRTEDLMWKVEAEIRTEKRFA